MKWTRLFPERNDVVKLKELSNPHLFEIANQFIEKRNTIVNMVSNPMNSQAAVKQNIILVAPITSKFRLMSAIHELGHIYTTKISDFELVTQHYLLCGSPYSDLLNEIEHQAWIWAKKVMMNFNMWCEDCETVAEICMHSYATSNSTFESKKAIAINDIYGEYLVDPRTGLLYSLD